MGITAQRREKGKTILLLIKRIRKKSMTVVTGNRKPQTDLEVVVNIETKNYINIVFNSNLKTSTIHRIMSKQLYT